MFKQNIYGSQPKIPYGMPDSSNPLPPEFFANPKCPLVLVVTRATTVEEDLIEPAKDPKENDFVGDQS